MRVELTGSFDVAVPVEQVWQRLMDPAFVAACAPGVESVEGIDDTHYRVKTLLGVGSVRLRFSMLLELADLVPPRSARMIVSGTATGSVLKADSSVQLAGQDHHTRVDWTIGSDVRGTLASTGARVLKGTARKLTEQFWKTFAHRVTKPAPTR